MAMPAIDTSPTANAKSSTPLRALHRAGKSMNEIGRDMRRRQAEQIFELTDGNDQCDADREPFDDRLGHKRDETACPDQTACNKNDPGKQRGEEQPVEAILLR